MDRKRFQEIWEDGLHHRSFVAGGILTVLMLSLAILSLIWTPYSVFTLQSQKQRHSYVLGSAVFWNVQQDAVMPKTARLIQKIQENVLSIKNG